MSIVHTYCFKFSAVAIEISCRIIVEWLRVRNINPGACCPNRWHRFRTSPTLQIPRKGAGGWGTLSCSQGHFPVVLSCQPCSGGDEVVGLSVRPVRTGSSRNFCLPRLQNWEKTVHNPFKSSFLEPVFFQLLTWAKMAFYRITAFLNLPWQSSLKWLSVQNLNSSTEPSILAAAFCSWQWARVAACIVSALTFWTEVTLAEGAWHREESGNPLDDNDEPGRLEGSDIY